MLLDPLNYYKTMVRSQVLSPGFIFNFLSIILFIFAIIITIIFVITINIIICDIQKIKTVKFTCG